MARLQPDLHQRVRQTLLRCGPFGSDSSLRAVFVDARIYPWRDHVPEAPGRAPRVDAIMEVLLDQADDQGNPALALFAAVLADCTVPGDACRPMLTQLAAELQVALWCDGGSFGVDQDSGARSRSEPEPTLSPDCDSLSPPGALPCCPFVAGPKITDPRLFVGRAAELRQLAAVMEGAQPISLNVVGERRIGKSSLLYHFMQTWEQRVQAPHRYVVIYLSLQEAAAQTEAGLYAALAGRLLARPAVQHRPDLAAALTHSPITRAEFEAVLRGLHDGGLLPVFCLDEFEALFRYPRQFDDGFYDALRALMDDSAVLLVLASHQPLDVYSRAQHLTSSFFNLGHLLALGMFTEAEAADLVRLPASTVRGAAAALSLEEQRLAQEWGGQHPYLLQLAASALCQARVAGHDVRWARECFEAEAQRIRRAGPRRRRHWLRPLRWLVWDAPLRLGRLAQKLGLVLDDVAAWLIGMGILLVVVLALTGVLSRVQVLDLLRRIWGG